MRVDIECATVPPIARFHSGLPRGGVAFGTPTENSEREVRAPISQPPSSVREKALRRICGPWGILWIPRPIEPRERREIRTGEAYAVHHNDAGL